MSDLALRVYDSGDCGPDGYPLAWHDLGDGRGVKDLIREAAGNRCVRCSHPYPQGAGEWSGCDELCIHAGPLRVAAETADGRTGSLGLFDNLVGARKLAKHLQPDGGGVYGARVEARWRILTVHHLRLGGDAKRDLRWWNLAALCQRCHLQVQGKVVMERIWPWPHSEWFKPYAAGWYAWSYLGEDLTRDQTEARLDELLALELVVA